MVRLLNNMVNIYTTQRVLAMRAIPISYMTSGYPYETFLILLMDILFCIKNKQSQ